VSPAFIMRLCHQCRTAIENHVTVCPRCGAAQATGPAVNPAGGPPKRGWFGPLMRDVRDVSGATEPLSALAALILVPVILVTRPWIVLPLVVGGVIGYVLGGFTGLGIGVIVGMVLVIANAAWRDHRKGR
jgi:hypothetical protein